MKKKIETMPIFFRFKVLVVLLLSCTAASAAQPQYQLNIPLDPQNPKKVLPLGMYHSPKNFPGTTWAELLKNWVTQPHRVHHIQAIHNGLGQLDFYCGSDDKPEPYHSNIIATHTIKIRDGAPYVAESRFWTPLYSHPFPAHPYPSYPLQPWGHPMCQPLPLYSPVPPMSFTQLPPVDYGASNAQMPLIQSVSLPDLVRQKGKQGAIQHLLSLIGSGLSQQALDQVRRDLTILLQEQPSAPQPSLAAAAEPQASPLTAAHIEKRNPVVTPAPSLQPSQNGSLSSDTQAAPTQQAPLAAAQPALPFSEPSHLQPTLQTVSQRSSAAPASSSVTTAQHRKHQASLQPSRPAVARQQANSSASTALQFPKKEDSVTGKNPQAPLPTAVATPSKQSTPHTQSSVPVSGPHQSTSQQSKGQHIKQQSTLESAPARAPRPSSEPSKKQPQQPTTSRVLPVAAAAPSLQQPPAPATSTATSSRPPKKDAPISQLQKKEEEARTAAAAAKAEQQSDPLEFIASAQSEPILSRRQRKEEGGKQEAAQIRKLQQAAARRAQAEAEKAKSESRKKVTDASGKPNSVDSLIQKLRTIVQSPPDLDVDPFPKIENFFDAILKGDPSNEQLIQLFDADFAPFFHIFFSAVHTPGKMPSRLDDTTRRIIAQKIKAETPAFIQALKITNAPYLLGHQSILEKADALLRHPVPRAEGAQAITLMTAKSAADLDTLIDSFKSPEEHTKFLQEIHEMEQTNHHSWLTRQVVWENCLLRIFDMFEQGELFQHPPTDSLKELNDILMKLQKFYFPFSNPGHNSPLELALIEKITGNKKILEVITNYDLSYFISPKLTEALFVHPDTDNFNKGLLASILFLTNTNQRDHLRSITAPLEALSKPLLSASIEEEEEEDAKLLLELLPELLPCLREWRQALEPHLDKSQPDSTAVGKIPFIRDVRRKVSNYNSLMNNPEEQIKILDPLHKEFLRAGRAEFLAQLLAILTADEEALFKDLAAYHKIKEVTPNFFTNIKQPFTRADVPELAKNLSSFSSNLLLYLMKRIITSTDIPLPEKSSLVQTLSKDPALAESNKTKLNALLRDFVTALVGKASKQN